MGLRFWSHAQLVHRIWKIASRIIFAALAIVVTLGAVVALRIYSGPIPIDFLTPYLKDNFETAMPGRTLEIGSTVLIWDVAEHDFNIRARDIKILNFAGDPQLRLGAVDIRISGRALLGARLAVKALEIRAAKLVLLRASDGSFGFKGLGQGDGAPAKNRPKQTDVTSADGGTLSALDGLLRLLLGQPDPSHPISRLESISLVAGEIAVRDAKTGKSWTVPVRRFELHRHTLGLAGDIDIGLAFDRSKARLVADYVYSRSSRKIEVKGSFSDFKPSALAVLISDLEPVKGFDISLSGTFTSVLGADGRLDTIFVQVTGGPGTLTFPKALSRPLRVATLKVRGRFDGAKRQAKILEMSLSLGKPGKAGPQLTGTATATISAGLRLVAKARLSGMSVRDLGRYWPKTAAVNARSWVTNNIPDGVIDVASVEIVMTAPAERFAAAKITRLVGSLRYRDFAVHYLRPLPPVTGITGQARFDQRQIKFSLNPGGKLAGLLLGRTVVTIAGLDALRARMEVQTDVSGPIKDVVSLIGHPRLNLLSGIGIKPNDTEGDLTAKLTLRLPLIAKLGFDDIDLAVRGRSNRLSISGPGAERMLSNVSFVMRHDRSGWKQVLVRGQAPITAAKGQRSPNIPSETNMPRPSGGFVLDLERTRRGTHTLSFVANDLGGLLRSLNIDNSGRGGHLTITGETRPSAPGDRFLGKMKLRDYTATKASFLARILSATTFAGLLRTVTTDGLFIDEFSGPFSYQKDVIRSDLLRLKAAAIRATARGQVDLAAKRLDIEGVIVPIGGVNRVLSNIPGIRRLVSKDGGIIAVNYRLEGPLDDPKIAILPLKSLTPRFLDRIFGAGGE